jgi:hypothetical protein
LETNATGFSKPWKLSPKFFRALEKSARNFPRLGKHRAYAPTRRVGLQKASAGHAAFTVEGRVSDPAKTFSVPITLQLLFCKG